jgi:transposase
MTMLALAVATGATTDDDRKARAEANFQKLKDYHDLGVRMGIPGVLAEVYQEQQWLILGYESFADACESIFGGFRLAFASVEERRQLVADLTDQGMSTRAIGSVVGVSKTTVADDQATAQDRTPGTTREVTGLDGRKQRITKKTPAKKTEPAKKTPVKRTKKTTAPDPAAEYDAALTAVEEAIRAAGAALHDHRTAHPGYTPTPVQRERLRLLADAATGLGQEMRADQAPAPAGTPRDAQEQPSEPVPATDPAPAPAPATTAPTTRYLTPADAEGKTDVGVPATWVMLDITGETVHDTAPTKKAMLDARLRYAGNDLESIIWDEGETPPAPAVWAKNFAVLRVRLLYPDQAAADLFAEVAGNASKSEDDDELLAAFPDLHVVVLSGDIPDRLPPRAVQDALIEAALRGEF